jgi:hypothetical protein
LRTWNPETPLPLSLARLLYSQTAAGFLSCFACQTNLNPSLMSMHAIVWMYMRIHTHAHANTRPQTTQIARTHVRAHTYTQQHTYREHTTKSSWASGKIHIKHTLQFQNTHVGPHTMLHTHACMYTHTHVRTHTDAHMHACIRTHMYMYALTQRQKTNGVACAYVHMR